MLTDERLRELWTYSFDYHVGYPFANQGEVREHFARAVEAEARKMALEEAAMVCESQECDWDDRAFKCGDKIRALISPPENPA